jgi:hypothetical protein
MPAALVSLQEAATAATDFANASKSAATRRTYQNDAADFAIAGNGARAKNRTRAFSPAQAATLMAAPKAPGTS